MSELDVKKDLQQFAATIRSIDAKARQLSYFFARNAVSDPFADDRHKHEKMKELFELPPGLPNLQQAATDKIAVYQDVRSFAKTAQETVSTSFDAIATCILPVLYALLGACAWLLRAAEREIKAQTFVADGRVTLFVIAAIGGLVVGLFNNFNIFNITQGTTYRRLPSRSSLATPSMCSSCFWTTWFPPSRAYVRFHLGRWPRQRPSVKVVGAAVRG